MEATIPQSTPYTSKPLSELRQDIYQHLALIVSFFFKGIARGYYYLIPLKFLFIH